MVVADAPVDLLAIKNRHALVGGDCGEPAEGKGGVRPFHYEAEGSFTYTATRSGLLSTAVPVGTCRTSSSAPRAELSEAIRKLAGSPPLATATHNRPRIAKRLDASVVPRAPLGWRGCLAWAAPTAQPFRLAG